MKKLTPILENIFFVSVKLQCPLKASVRSCCIHQNKNQARCVVIFQVRTSTYKHGIAFVLVYITKSWLRTSRMLKIETKAIAKNFRIFWSLQVSTYVYAYRTLRA